MKTYSVLPGCTLHRSYFYKTNARKSMMRYCCEPGLKALNQLISTFQYQVVYPDFTTLNFIHAVWLLGVAGASVGGGVASTPLALGGLSPVQAPCALCMFFTYLCGPTLTAPNSTHSSKTCSLEELPLVSVLGVCALCILGYCAGSGEPCSEWMVMDEWEALSG